MKRLASSAVALAALFLVAAVSTGFARGHKAGGTSQAVSKPQQVTLRATINAVDAKHNRMKISWLTEKQVRGKVHTRRHHKAVSVTSETQVTFQGKSLGISDVKPGSTADITVEKRGRRLVATRIEIQSEPTGSALGKK